MKKLIVLLLILALLSNLIGCTKGTELPVETKPTEPPALTAVDPGLPTIEAIPSGEPITVCIKDAGPGIVDAAMELIELWEYKNPGCKAQLVKIPKEASDAERFMKKLRTEIMAGGGPDVFIADQFAPSPMDPWESLFPNPETVMENSLFLPLDDFMKRAKHLDVNTLHTAVLAAGQTDEGQVVLPLGYTFSIYGLKADAFSNENIPCSWDALLDEKCKAFWEAGCPTALADVFPALADHKAGKLYFSPDELTATAMQINGEKAALSENLLFSSLSYDNLPGILEDHIAQINGGCTLMALPNKTGGVTATVAKFVAINRNTKQQENAWSFVDFLYSPELLSGLGIKRGSMTNGWGQTVPLYYGSSIVSNFLTVPYVDCICVYNEKPFNAYERLQENQKAEFQSILSRIDSVRFRSELDEVMRGLDENFLMGNYFGAMLAVETACTKMEMILAE